MVGLHKQELIDALQICDKPRQSVMEKPIITESKSLEIQAPSASEQIEKHDKNTPHFNTKKEEEPKVEFIDFLNETDF
jgi:hypothetical protein